MYNIYYIKLYIYIYNHIEKVRRIFIYNLAFLRVSKKSPKFKSYKERRCYIYLHKKERPKFKKPAQLQVTNWETCGDYVTKQMLVLIC